MAPLTSVIELCREYTVYIECFSLCVCVLAKECVHAYACACFALLCVFGLRGRNCVLGHSVRRLCIGLTCAPMWAYIYVVPLHIVSHHWEMLIAAHPIFDNDFVPEEQWTKDAESHVNWQRVIYWLLSLCASDFQPLQTSAKWTNANSGCVVMKTLRKFPSIGAVNISEWLPSATTD